MPAGVSERSFNGRIIFTIDETKHLNGVFEMRRFLTTAAVIAAVFTQLAFSDVGAAHAGVIMKIVNSVDSSTTLAPPAGGPLSATTYQFSSTSMAGFSEVTLTDKFLAPTVSPPKGPGIDLGAFSVDASTGGTLDVFVTLTDLVASSAPATLSWSFTLAAGNLSSGGAVDVQTWVNGDNTPFGTPPGGGTSGVVSFPTSSPANESSVAATVPVGVFFSMTLWAKITLPASGSLTSGDFSARISTVSGPQIQEGPEPASMAIWGLGLMLAGGVRHLRRKQAEV